jgi:nitronate monooxygenase
MITTRFTELVGCTVPIEVAPMGAVSTPQLVAAAGAAGAFGMIGTTGQSAAQVSALLDAIAELTDAPVGANMLMPFVDEALVEATAPRVKLFDFYHGDPDKKLVELVHAGGAIAGWQVGSLDEAKQAVDAGCDVLAVRGVEGGGRMHGDQPLSRDLAAVIAAGADGARMGTRFVATDESGAHPVYKQAIVDADPTDTVLVSDFSAFWPGGPQPHRVLRRSVQAAYAVEGDTVGEAMVFGERRPVPKFAPSPPAGDVSGNIEAFPMYAGMSVYGIDRIEPAAALIGRLVRGAEELLSTRSR